MFKALIPCNVKVKAMFSFSQYLYMHIKLNSLMMYNASINFIFRGACIVINSYNETNEMHKFLKSILGIELYMFWRVSLSIVRSLALYIAICICHTGYADCLLAGSVTP